MKKIIIAGACLAAATCFLAACGGEGGSKAPVTVEKRAAPPEAEKIKPPDAVVSEGLKSNKEAPPDMPKKKAGE